MSAFNVSDEHIRYLVAAHWRYDHNRHNLTLDELQGFAVMLRNANVQSVNYRYQNEPEPWMVGPLVSDFPIGWGDIIDRKVDALMVLKAIKCLIYQACETPEWSESPAAEWLADLSCTAICNLPGWDDAPGWEIADAPQSTRDIRRIM